LGGRYIGYRANYYSPALYRSMVDYCGFDGVNATVDSGSNKINHVVMARATPGEPRAIVSWAASAGSTGPGI
jgi:hypothetical protein